MSVPGQEELVRYSMFQNQCRRACGHTLQSCFLLGQAAFLAVGQHASVMQDELERPKPFLMERKFLPWTVFWHSNSWWKSSKHA